MLYNSWIYDRALVLDASYRLLVRHLKLYISVLESFTINQDENTT